MRPSRDIRFVLILAVVLAASIAAPARAARPDPVVPWDVQALYKAPAVHPAEGFDAKGVRAVFYDSVPLAGKPTRVFAYIGLPEKIQPGQKVPAMVCVHGGGGTAFDEWVRVWAARGYAAIAMDTSGGVPKKAKEGKGWARHDHSGPGGWGGFDQLDRPVQDQWSYHAVAAVILGHSLLRSLPEVDAERTGLTGISWGGYLTCMVSGLDSRFKLAIPVYGCGFLDEDSAWVAQFPHMGTEKAQRWLAAFDPSSHLPKAKMPMLWVTGTNDFAYPFGSLQKSYRLPTGLRALCIRVRFAHGHGIGWKPDEIYAFADHVLCGKRDLPRITGQGRDGQKVWASFRSPVPAEKAELNFTKDPGPKWQKRLWETIPARIDAATGRVEADLPKDAAVYYFNVFDKDKLCASSEHAVVGGQ